MAMAVQGQGSGGVVATIDNRSELPDHAVQEAVMAHFAESNASLQFGQPSTFQLYSNSAGTNMLTRSPFRVPSNVIDEIKLARMVAETDDDIAAVIGSCLTSAYGEGMRNQHEDEDSLHYYNRVARLARLDNRFKEMHREYMIAGQLNTLTVYTRQRVDFTPSGSDKRLQTQLSTPVIGVLPSEDIRVLSNDLFGEGELAYDPPNEEIRHWLEEFFNEKTTPARKNALASEEKVLAAMFTGAVKVDWNDADAFTRGRTLYKLNPRLVHRSTLAKGASAYPRPPITANFALLEAKRLLNIMDYALLQGGTNYIVVAKQGSDQLPAQQPEIDNLTDIVRSASRTGVLVGDHRLQIEIITPNLGELLNPEKRKLIGRKLAMSLLRIPEQVTGDSGGEGAKQESEFMARSITSDRQDIKRHVENNIYEEVEKRNRSTFKKGPASIWFPKIVLSGIGDYFTAVMKARDRGDLPRSAGVELLGFDYEAQVAQRKREKARGDDEVMQAVGVPFNGAPGDEGGDGRPPGSSNTNGRPGNTAPPVDPAQRQRVAQPAVRRPRGEPVRASYDEERGETLRVGEMTYAMLDEYPEATIGRVTDVERRAVGAQEVLAAGTAIVVPVNPGYEVDPAEVRAFRLTDDLRMVVGQRRDNGALVAKALCFREPHFTEETALDAAMRYGFVSEVIEVAEERERQENTPPTFMEVVAQATQNPEAMAAVVGGLKEVLGALAPNVQVVLPQETEWEIVRDESGAIIGKRPKLPEST